MDFQIPPINVTKIRYNIYKNKFFIQKKQKNVIFTQELQFLAFV